MNRARLWDEGSRIHHASLPTPGRIMAVMKQNAAAADLIDAAYDHRVRDDLCD